MSMSPVKVVPVARVTRRRQEGKPDVVSVECPECREMWICLQTDFEKRRNLPPVCNIHECEAYRGPLFFLNVSEPGKEVVVYGAAEYNAEERASVKRLNKQQ